MLNPAQVPRILAILLRERRVDHRHPAVSQQDSRAADKVIMGPMAFLEEKSPHTGRGGQFQPHANPRIPATYPFTSCAHSFPSDTHTWLLPSPPSGLLKRHLLRGPSPDSFYLKLQHRLPRPPSPPPASLFSHHHPYVLLHLYILLHLKHFVLIPLFIQT